MQLNHKEILNVKIYETNKDKGQYRSHFQLKNMQGSHRMLSKFFK